MAEHSAIMEMIHPAAAVRPNRMASSANLPSLTEVIETKKQKRILTEGTELFNQDPKKGASVFLEEVTLNIAL